MPAIQLVVCDMAGTTVQDHQDVERCFLAAAERTDLKVAPERIVAMMGWSKRGVFETLWAEQMGEGHPDVAAKVEASFTQFKIVLEEHYRTKSIAPTEGCLELFGWLKSQQIKIALTTGFYRVVANIILERLGWNQGLNHNYTGSATTLIQASITPSEIFNSEGRPAPFMIQKAMYRSGVVDPQTVINIGDTPVDLASGINAHCLYSFGVTNGSHTQMQLAQHPNHGLFPSLFEVQEKLASLLL